MKKILLGLVALILLSSCAVNQTIKYDGLKLDLFDIKTKNIDLALLDHREQVVNGSKKPDFVGYMRSGVGIAYTIKTKSKNEFVVDLSNNIVNSLAKFDINVTNLKTKYQDDENTVKQELLKLNGNKKILLVIDQLHTDGYGIEFLKYKINLYIYDKDGKLLKYKAINGDEKLGGNIAFGPGSYKTYMPDAVSKLFENILKDKEILEIINND
ncbi:lipoprotein [Flavobacterium adhaerens]|uniref:lipoprotein n=1 Tax=Flavobacterium adhaerens TaxID=3149043 RepID=UPI0032B52D5D